jgi:hypothetical protein
MDFNQNKARAAQQSKLCKRRVTMGWVKFHPVPLCCARKNAGTALQILGIGPYALRFAPYPHVFSRSNAGVKQVLAGPGLRLRSRMNNRLIGKDGEPGIWLGQP